MMVSETSINGTLSADFWPGVLTLATDWQYEIIDGQLYDRVTGFPLFDEITGLPIVA